MKRFLFFYCFVLFFSCNNKGDKENTSQSDNNFHNWSEKFLKEYLAWRPQLAVALGFHEYDGKTSDFSKASIEKEFSRLDTADLQLSAIDTSKLDTKAFYDYRILQLAIRNELSNFRDLKVYSHNPMVYAGAADVNLYIKRNYAPLEQRVNYVIATEKQIPGIFAAARANLDDSLAKPHIETAISIAEGSVSFLKGDLIIALKEIKDSSLMLAFKDANQKAIAATNDFVSWLKKEKMPKANASYAIGVDNYKKMLLYSEDISLSPDQILAIGLAELKKEQERFNAAAAAIDPTKKPIDVYHAMNKEHPVADSLIPEARKHLEIIRQFLVDKNIITIPSEVRVQVKETPQYARSLGTASMDVPGPFEKATEAYYYITPVDPVWNAKQKEDWLASFDYYVTDNVTVHEAYPGHYTQFLHLNTSGASNIEKIFGSYAFIEGWAHYTEKMMIDEGFGSSSDTIRSAKYRLAQSGDALLRICRLCVSVKMHCQGMTVEQATKFFMDNWYQGEQPSKQEAMRGTFDPGYLFYTVGKLEILKLRADYQQQEGNNYSLKKFNDLMLDNGMPPIPFLREVILKDKASWKATL